jgi:hypothetical protein
VLCDVGSQLPEKFQKSFEKGEKKTPKLSNFIVDSSLHVKSVRVETAKSGHLPL